MNGINSNSNNIFDQLEDIQERVERHRVEVEALNGRVTILEESFGILSRNPTIQNESFVTSSRNPAIQSTTSNTRYYWMAGSISLGLVTTLAVGIIFGPLAALAAFCGCGIVGTLLCTMIYYRNPSKENGAENLERFLPLRYNPSKENGAENLEGLPPLPVIVENLPPIPEKYRNPQQVLVNFSELTDEQKSANLIERLNNLREIRKRNKNL